MEFKIYVAFFIPLAFAYLTVHWAKSKKINTTLTGVFFGFAILGGLAIANYDNIITVKGFGVEIETIRNQVNTAKTNAQKAIDIANKIRQDLQTANEIADQRNKILNDTNDLVKKAKSTADEANQIAKEAKNQSGTFGAIQAWAFWSTIQDDYLEIDNRLKKWEKGKKLKRETPSPSSPEEFEKILNELDTVFKLTDDIKQVYRQRHRKYEILKKLSERYTPFADQFAQIEFTLPSLPTPPKFPTARKKIPPKLIIIN